MFTAPAARRLFLALWPDPQVRPVLAAAARSASARGARPVAVDNLHITLVFLGSCDPARERCVEQGAAAAAGVRFTLRLDQVGWFPRARVAWLAPSVPPPALLALQQGLVDALVPCGFKAEPRPFHAHLTVLRECRAQPLWQDFTAVEWPVPDFALVQSRTEPGGVRYEVRRRFALAS